MTMTRRAVFATAGAAASAIALSRRAGAQSFDFKPNQRYPDASVEILDPSFARHRIFSSSVEQLASGMRWAEGPVWFGDGRYVLVSDIPNNRIMRYDEANGNWGVFRQPSNFANGNARDRQGRLLSCEHLTRRVTRTEYDGKITVLADSFDGKRFNSPNDIVCKSDGSIWFTDPPFGIAGDGKATRRRRNCRIRFTASRLTASLASPLRISPAPTGWRSRRTRKNSTSSNRARSRTA
jgi:gluconolactonase